MSYPLPEHCNEAAGGIALSIPKKVFLREEGPREGFQFLKQTIPTEKKLELIRALTETGIESMEVTAFVRPDKVPQHADAAEVALQLPESKVRYRALYLNEKGFDLARACPKLSLEGTIMIAGSEAFLKKNSNMSLSQALDAIPAWVKRFEESGISYERLMVSTAFGDSETGILDKAEVLEICKKAIERARPEEITFADTTGFADPDGVRALVRAAQDLWPEIALGLHLHDTRGTGMANVYAGLLEGVSRFDCSVAGLGGCPFTHGAAGNVPTEDVAYLCERLGAKTGLDLDAYVRCAQLAETITGQSLPGKLKKLTA